MIYYAKIWQEKDPYNMVLRKMKENLNVELYHIHESEVVILLYVNSPKIVVCTELCHPMCVKLEKHTTN